MLKKLIHKIFNSSLSKLTVVAVISVGWSGIADAKSYIVKYRSDLKNMPMSFGFSQVSELHLPGQLALVSVSQKNEALEVLNIMSDPNVEYVVENVKVRSFTEPMNPQTLREQWSMSKINASKAWELAGTRGDKSILLAVIDTGIDYNHRNLSSNMVPGYDFRDNDDDPMDDTSSRNPGHGTHCGGISAANGLVDGGIIGIAPEIAMMPIRFLGSDGSGDLMGGIKSIDYAIEKGADVINASWGAAIGAQQAKPLIEAVKRASDAGVLFVAAASNDGKNNDTFSVYPANAIFENTITVAASDRNDAKPSWSNFGRNSVSIAAPGHEIMSTLPRNSFGNLSGTSMAAPLVAGLAALMKARDPSLTGAQIRSIMQLSGASVQIESMCNCRIDAAAAIQKVIDKPMYITPSAWAIQIDEKVQLQAVNAVGTVRFESSNPDIATVSAEGLVTGKGRGEFVVTATDSQDNTTQTLPLSVFIPGSGGGGGEACPLPAPMCDMLCEFEPQLPWCNQKSH